MSGETCLVEGCEKPRKARGMCMPHYHRWRATGTPNRAQKRSSAGRFWAKVEKTDGCWLWTGATNRAGYGEFQDGVQQMLAHRLIYEWVVGPISRGLVLDHLCREPRCVNPSHLEAVSDRENILRGIGATALNARKTNCVRGHPLDEENTYLRAKDGSRHCRTCHREAERLRRQRTSA